MRRLVLIVLMVFAFVAVGTRQFTSSSAPGGTPVSDTLRTANLGAIQVEGAGTKLTDPIFLFRSTYHARVTTVVATAGDQISIASRFNDVDTPMASLAVPRGETTQMIAFATDGGELWIHVIAAPSTQWKVLIYVR